MKSLLAVPDKPPHHRRDAYLLFSLFTGIAGILVPFVFDTWWKTHRSLSLALVLVLLLGVIAVGLQVSSYSLLGEISSRVGIIVKYYPADSTGSIYDEARRVVGRAKKSILVLNSCLVEEKGDPDADTSRKKAYFKELLDRVNDGVEYKRLLQAEDVAAYATSLEADDPHVFDHLVQMQSFKAKVPGGYAVLKRCVPTRLTNFVLVDDVHLIWQITEISGKGPEERTRLLGAFIFDDPQSLITGHFRQYFRQMDNKSEPVPPLAARKEPRPVAAAVS